MSLPVNQSTHEISLDCEPKNETIDLEQILEQPDEPPKKPKRKRATKKTKEEKPKTPVTLFDYQRGHKDKIIEILNKSPFAFDFSMLGTGKTYTTSFIFQHYRGNRFNHLISIAPVSVKSKWKQMERDHGICLHKSISFCEVRSVKFKQPKHGLLSRRDYMHKVKHDDETTTEIEKVEYKCTDEYLKLVEEGVLLVIDEIQNIKNASNQLDACKELMRPIFEAYKKDPVAAKSRVILLSGSPIDKKVQVIHLFKALGICKHEKLSVYNPQTWQMMWRGMADIENYCKAQFGEEPVETVRDSFWLGYPDERELEEYCYRLFKILVKDSLSSAMNPLDINTHIAKQNANYIIQEEKDRDLLRKGVDLLQRATRFNSASNTVDFGANGIESLRSVVRALTMVETAKINTFMRVARQHLEANPNKKVVITVNYTDTINDLMEGLDEFEPLRLDGSVTAKRRGEIIEQFQAPNTERRLLIGNLSVCSTGIDLDDQDGNFPRICLVSPNYSTITLYQLSHRFQRAATKSDATIHFVFGKDITELPILNALAQKSSIMKEITDNQVEYGVVFPGDYEEWNEEELSLEQ